MYTRIYEGNVHEQIPYLGDYFIMNTTKQRNMTIGYIAINVLYFCVFCSIHGYAAVFLLDRGFSNALVGTTLAAANILSVIGQPLLAGIVDKSRRVTNRLVIMLSSAVLIIGVILLLLIKTNTVFIFIIFALVYTLQFVYQSNMIAMNFEYQRAGCKINFGLARGLGSAGFAVSSAILGGFVEKNGTDLLLYFTIIALTLLIIVTYFFKKPTEDVQASAQDSEHPSGALEFFRKYKRFMLFVLGTAFCFFSHNMLNDFLIQIIRSLGGGEAQLGYATFLAAILELPVMAFIGIVLKKTKANRILVFSAVAFLLKNAVMLLATDLVGMYLSQACQMLAYAVFIPTSAYYAEAEMDKCDKVKGQAFINSAITLGGVFSNLICGKILDVSGVRVMLITGLAVCFIGLMIIFIAVRNSKTIKNAT